MSVSALLAKMKRLGIQVWVDDTDLKVDAPPNTLTQELRAELDIEGGVVVQSVEPGPAARAGIRQGDVIVMLDNRAVDDARRFVEIAEALEPKRSVAVLVQRGEGPLFLALRLDEDE